MSQYGAPTSYRRDPSPASSFITNPLSREPGARRKKLAGYFNAANEIRKSYQDSWRAGRDERVEDYIDDGMPGAFQDAAIVRSGEEEMMLFPSYARRHVKKKPRAVPGTIQEFPGDGRDARDSLGAGDAEFWRTEWDKYQDDHAIVDVDVRGWIYTPSKGQLNRKNRIFISLARRLVGIPGPGGNQNSASPSPSNSRSPSPAGHRDRMKQRAKQQEEELVSQEAEAIVRKGEREAAVATRGGYSEVPRSDNDSMSVYSAKTTGAGAAARAPSNLGSEIDGLGHSETDLSNTTPMATKRDAWLQPHKMSREDLAEANARLMIRLRHFLVNPVSTTISVFFWNESKSASRSVRTDPQGYFNLHAPLEFLPTHYRVIASEKLSATEQVRMIEPKGVSVISDIDDTVKHSAIASGAREIFRNAFIRDLGDLMIDGVKEWYNQLAHLGVTFHYVSNSPWQLYPVLNHWFSLAGLPHGSFHLKAYKTYYEGIFEPVAERKKGTLDKIARDFPERRFILIGDSGEADLEVYVDFALDNPGRVLGIFIRDVTTHHSKGFFDPSMGPLAGNGRPGISKANTTSFESNKSRTASVEEDDPELKAAIQASLREFSQEENRRGRQAALDSDAPGNRPALPLRERSDPGALETTQKGPPMGNLIDFDDDPTPAGSRTASASQSQPKDYFGNIDGSQDPERKSPSPAPPRKPVSLRSRPSQEKRNSHLSPSPSMPQLQRQKTPPPKPRRPSTSVHKPPQRVGSASSATKSPPPIPEKSTKPLMVETSSKPPIPPPSRKPTGQKGYLESARDTAASAYNSLPSASSFIPGAGDGTNDNRPSSSQSQRYYASNKKEMPEKKAPPVPPPRKAGQPANSRISGIFASYAPPTSSSLTGLEEQGQFEPPNPPFAQGGNSGRSSGPTTPSEGAIGSLIGQSNRMSGAWSGFQSGPLSPAQTFSTDSKSRSVSKSPATTPTGATKVFKDPNYGLSGNGMNGVGQRELGKKEEMWMRRWARARDVLKGRGIILRSWRVGTDVMTESARLVEKANKQDEENAKEERRKQNSLKLVDESDGRGREGL